jgi:1-deoxy-D-xylulose-5-phosphate reductoisomerase
MKHVVVLGSTGSVGRQALDLARLHPDQVRVVGLTAGCNVDLLAQQLAEFQPDTFAVADPAAGERLLREHPEWRGRCAGLGPDAVCGVAASRADVVLNGLTGYAGLRPTLAALGAGTDLALANKESMVVAGELVRQAADRSGARLLPVDSEHSAIHQCLRAGRHGEVRRLVLTASGGPFRGRSRAELAGVTRADALRHPTWSMGPKISVDSATLMNKGLEVIEAHWLFGIDFDRIDILVHPQSIVHSMVEFVDGSVIAQLSTTDMRLPTWIALHDPERQPADFGRLDLAQIGTLSFETLDDACFPSVRLAVEAGRRGGVFPAILNAANEVAVEAFLDERLPFLDIPAVLETVLAAGERQAAAGRLDLEIIAAADARAREEARRCIGGRCAAGEGSC